MKKGLIKYEVKLKGGNKKVVTSINIEPKQYFNGIDIFKKLAKDDKNRIIFTKTIKDLLERDDDEIDYLVSKIYSYAEFDEIICAIEALNTFLPGMEKKDTKNGHRKRKSFEDKRDKFIQALIENGQYREIENIKKIKYINIIYYEDELYNQKQQLYASLVNNCKCSKTRANEIIEILEYI